MDPVTAIGFASSILTFIEFSWDIVTGTYEVYKSTTGSTSENAHIGTVIDDLEKVTEDLTPDLELTTKHGKALHQLAEKCNRLSKDLSKILKKLQASGKDSKWQSLKVKLASLRKEKEVISIEKRLDQYRSQIIMRLNFMLSEQQSSLKMQLDKIQSEGSKLSTESANQFAIVRMQLDENLQAMLQNSNENANLNCKNEAEQMKSLEDIRDALGQLQTMVKQIPRENSILRRLYFKSMYIREDTVADAESGTFTWIVENDTRSNRSPNIYTDTASENSNSSQDEEDIYIQAEANAEQVGARPEGTELNVEKQEHILQDEDNPKLPAENIDDPEIWSLGEDSSTMSPKGRGWDNTSTHTRTRRSFLTWLATGSGIYHISGKAGSGKSTLMKFLSSHPRVRSELETWAGTKQLIFTHFFFWNSGDRLQMSLEGLYRSILFEALKQCPELIPQIFPITWDRIEAEVAGLDDYPLRLSELKSAFNNLINNQNFTKHRFCFFIDGLDEFEGDSFQHWELARSLKRWTKSDDIKICVSSRPHTEFMVTFSDDDRLRLRLHEITSGDISRFALAMFEKDENFIKTKDIYSDLVRDIVDMADGVFLWARLVVHSLLDGIGNRYSDSALKDKLSAIPKDLGELFNSLLEAVDPGDRKRSDKLLLIASFATTTASTSNAITYTWIDDLDDPQFPFSSPVQGCSDEDIHKRYEDLRCQLNTLSKGLLEMTEATRSEGDIYFKYDVQFFHRSVRDYLEQPSRQKEIRSRILDFDPSDAYMRLKLAEFKFARTTAKYFEAHSLGSSNLFSCFSSAFDKMGPLKMSSQKAHFELLDEYGRVLDNHRRLPFFHPSETEKNPGHILWGHAMDTSHSTRGIVSSGDDISYPYWVTSWEQDEYARKLASEDNELVKGNREMNLLLTAALQADRETVAFLLENGAKPHQHVSVRAGKNQSEEVWMIFLLSLAEWSLDGTDIAWVDTRFAVLECLLNFGVDSEVFFLVYENKHENREAKLSRWDTGDAGQAETIEVPDSELFVITLRHFVQLWNPSNHQSITDFLLKREATSLWRQTKRAILSLTSWGQPSLVVPSKYKTFEKDSLGGLNYWLHSVHSRTSSLYPGFKARVW